MEDFREIWPGWKTVRIIGRGTYGVVYQIEREMFGHKEYAALKVLSIPEKESDIDDLISEGFNSESITQRFRSYLEDIIREYAMMADMKGCSNIVYCDDVKYIQHADGYGWDIYIKMELISPLNKELLKPGFLSEEKIIKIGKDICNALVFCEKRNIIHRDIKPQNIFVAPDGTFKLGDFGVAKITDKTASGTVAGTYNYMAPEVYNHQPYGSRADIYSLGMVLYWLLNMRRGPFLPLPPETSTSLQEEKARQRRFSGEAVPAPVLGSSALKQTVLRAISFSPNGRYADAEEMLAALSRAEQDFGEEVETDDDKTVLIPRRAVRPASEKRLCPKCGQPVGPDGQCIPCRKKELAEEQARLKQLEEEQARQKQLEEEQARQKQLEEEQARQKQLEEEQARQKQLEEEQARQRQLEEEQAQRTQQEDARFKHLEEAKARRKQLEEEFEQRKKREKENAGREPSAGSLKDKLRTNPPAAKSQTEQKTAGGKSTAGPFIKRLQAGVGPKDERSGSSGKNGNGNAGRILLIVGGILLLGIIVTLLIILIRKGPAAFLSYFLS